MCADCQNFDPKIRSDDQKKNSYENRDYESVDEMSLYLKLCLEKLRKKEFRQ